jgi:hypothetical protein
MMEHLLAKMQAKNGFLCRRNRNKSQLRRKEESTKRGWKAR